MVGFVVSGCFPGKPHPRTPGPLPGRRGHPRVRVCRPPAPELRGSRAPRRVRRCRCARCTRNPRWWCSGYLPTCGCSCPPAGDLPPSQSCVSGGVVSPPPPGGRALFLRVNTQVNGGLTDPGQHEPVCPGTWTGGRWAAPYGYAPLPQVRRPLSNPSVGAETQVVHPGCWGFTSASSCALPSGPGRAVTPLVPRFPHL